MLRPLTSIYRRLEKHHETLGIIAAESRTEDHNEATNTHAPLASEALTARDSCSGSEADEKDPVWVPGRKADKRRVRHKYSGRGEGQASRKRTRLSIHSPEAPRTLPGAIELATPLITGKRWELPSSGRSQHSVEQAKSHRQAQLQVFRDKYPLHKSPWQELLDQTGDSGFASIAHNLDRVLTNFLRNTRILKRDSGCPSGKPDRGARSLLSMVARHLPEFIASEQEAQDEMDENEDEDMCDAYFTELESFYAPHGRGWKPLREAVRAQGIFLVSTMIQRKWVPDPIAYALIENCRLNESDDACESFLATFLSTCTSYPYPQALKPTADSSLPDGPIRLLRKYASSAAHRSYVFDELAKLLSRGVLPPEWMATRLWTNWMTRATISFSKGDDHCSAASRLIEAVIVSASDIRTVNEPPKRKKRGRPPKRNATCGRPTRTSSAALAIKSDPPRPCPLLVEDALSNHVKSLMAALCGMHISRSREVREGENVKGTDAEYIIKNLSFALERASAAKPPSHLTTLASHHLLRRGCILLSDCLLQCNDAVLTGDCRYVMASTPILEKLCETLAPRLDLVKELALFLRQAFRCFGSSTEFERLYMGREVRRMVSMFPHLADAPGLSTLLGQVAVEAAMQFTEWTGEPDDHLWAMEIQETVIALQNGQRVSSESTDEPDERSQQRGYRWEESIGEWVARTPTTRTNVAPIIWTKTRASTVADSSRCIPCSTDTSSPETERFQASVSSLPSSPPSVGTKRDFDCIDSSPLHPAKRRQSTRVGVIDDNTERRRCASRPASTRSKSPSLVPYSPERRVLRELSNRGRPTRATSARNRAASKIEVVVINKKETCKSEEPVQSPAEPAEKEVHRAVERRRPGRPRLSSLPNPPVRAVSERRSVIPCSQDDSDDELSFM